MPITLYTVSGAPRGWRVLVALAIKQLEYQVKYIQVSKNELRSEFFLKLNPRATIPVLEDKEQTLRDSIAILAWLDSAYPKFPLFGNTLTESSKIWQLTTECADYLRSAVHELLTPVLVKHLTPDLKSEQGLDILKSAKTLHDECQFLEKQLRSQKFIATSFPSAADAIVYPELKLVLRAMETRSTMMNRLGFDDFEQVYPRLTQWIKNMDELPGISNTQPIHW